MYSKIFSLPIFLRRCYKNWRNSFPIILMHFSFVLKNIFSSKLVLSLSIFVKIIEKETKFLLSHDINSRSKFCGLWRISINKKAVINCFRFLK